jgi:hypothetical protein
MQPKIIENPDLTASFSDEEVEVMSHNIVLPHPEYLFYFGWETDRGFHTDIPLRTTAYEFGDRTIHIRTPPDLKHIYASAGYYFLTEVKEETTRLDAEMKTSKYLHSSGIDEINFSFGLLSAKILAYADNFGYSASPSWTLAKDVPEDIINVMRAKGDRLPMFVHMAQLHIYYMSYIETFWPDVDITKFRSAQFPFVDKEHVNVGYVKAYNWDNKDYVSLKYLRDLKATDTWERIINAPHEDDGPPCKRRRIGDYEPGDNEPERYSPTSPEYCP